MTRLLRATTRRRLGFTLLEIVITLVVIAVLAASAVFAYATIAPRISADQTKSMLSAVATAQQARYRSKGDFVGVTSTGNPDKDARTLDELTTLANPANGFVNGDQPVTTTDQVSVAQGTWNGWIKMVAMAAQTSDGTCLYNVTFDPNSGKSTIEGTLTSGDCSGLNVLSDPAISNVAASQTPPGVPAAVVGTPGPGTALLEWSAGTGSTSGYQIFRCQVSDTNNCTDTDPDSSGFGFTYLSDVVSSTRFTDTTVSSGTTYKYMIRAFNSAGLSEFAAPVPVVPADPSTKRPDRPTGLHVVSAADGAVTIGWNPSPNATTYRIYRDGALLAQGVNITEFPDDGTGRVTPGTPPAPAAGAAYTYRVDAESVAGVSFMYTGLKVVVPPKAPTDTVATALDSDTAACTAATCVTVSFTAPSYSGPDNAQAPLTDYTLYRCDAATNPCQPQSAGAVRVGALTAANPPPMFTDTGLAGASTYTYTVTASNSGGSSAPSPTATVTTALNPPTGLHVGAGDPGTLTITFNPVDGANGYRIYQIAANGTRTAIATTSDPHYTVTGLGGFTTRTYQVAAVNAVGAGARSASVSGTTGPAPLTGVTISASSQSATIGWEFATGVTYSITRDGTQIASGLTTDTYTDTGLTPATAYTYIVTATADNGSASSGPRATVTAPVPVTGVSAATTATTTTVTFTTSPGTNTYRVMRCTGTSCTPNSIIGTTTTGSYTDSSGAAGTFYTYAVITTNSVNTASAASASVTTATIPTAVTGLVATSRTTDARLTWAASTTATSYNVYRCNADTNGSCIPTAGDLIGSAVSAAYTDTGAQSAVTYRYAVRAVNSAGQSPDSLTVLGGRGPTPPTGITATVTTNDPGNGPVNLVTNPGMNPAGTPWVSSNPAATVTYDTTTGVADSSSIKIRSTDITGADSGAQPNQTLTVTPGATYTLTGYYKTVVGAKAFLGMSFSDTSGIISSPRATTAAAATSGWGAFTATFTAPSGTRNATSARITAGAYTTNTDVWWDDIIATATGTVSYFDGDTAGAWWTGTPYASTSVMPAGTLFNLAGTQPSVTSGVSGWTAGANAGSATRDTSSDSLDGSSYRVTATNSVYDTSVTYGPVSAGSANTYSAAVMVKWTGAAGGITPTLVYRSADGTVLGSVDGDMPSNAAATWSPLSISNSTPPANTATVSLIITVDGGYVNAGDQLWVDNVIISPTATPPMFFDGNTPGAVWAGAADTSTSIKAATGYNVNVNWISSGPSVTYDVLRCPGVCTQLSPAFTTISTGLHTTSYLDANVVPGISYTYTVRAVKGSFTGDTGIPATATVTLANPSNLTFTAITPTTATAAWTYSLGATGYTITDTNGSTLATVTGARTHTAQLSGLAPGQRYTLRVNATSALATSTGSDTAVLTTSMPAPTPVNRVSSSTTTISINWAAVTSGPGTLYDVYLCTGTSCTPNTVAISNLSVTSATLTGLSANTGYRIAVAAKTMYATSPQTPAVSAWTIAEPPTGLTVASVAGGYQNLTENPNFESGDITWATSTPDDVTVAQDTSVHHSGQASLVLTVTSGNAPTQIHTTVTGTDGTGGYPGIIAGITYQAAAWVYYPGTGSRQAWVGVDFRSSSGSSIGYDHDSVAVTTVPANTWTLVSSGPVVAPAGATRASIDIGRDTTSQTTGASLNIDDVLLGTVPGPVSYFDGSSPGAVWTGTPNLSASVTSPAGPNTAAVTWTPVPHALSYTVYRDGQAVATTTNTGFLDAGVNHISSPVATGADISGSTSDATASTGVTLAVTTEAAASGTHSFRADASTSTPAAANLIRVGGLAVTAGSSYTFSLQIRKPVTGSVNFSGHPEIVFYNSSGDILSDTSTAVTPVSTTFTRLSVTATAPPDAVSAAVAYRLPTPTGLTGPAVAYLDNLQFETGTTATDFQPGTLNDRASAVYTVAVTNAGGLSAPSSWVTATLPPGPPVNVTALSGYRQNTVSFSAVTGASAYTIYRCTGEACTPNTVSGTVSGGTGTVTYVDTSELTDHTTYTYRVAAGVGTGAGRMSSPVTVTTVNAVNTYPDPVFTSITSTSAVFTWNAPDGATTYRVYRCLGMVCDPVTNPDAGYPVTTSSTTVAESGLNAGATYQYAISAGNGDGWAPATSGQTLTLKPVSPVFAAASPSATSTQISMSWTPSAVDNLTSYNVRIGASPAAVAAGTTGSVTLPAAATTYTFTVNPATTYSVSVSAVNAAGESDAATATLSSRAATPINLTGVGGPAQGQTSLSWTGGPAGQNPVTRYSLYREQDIINDPGFSHWAALPGTGTASIDRAPAGGHTAATALSVTGTGDGQPSGAYTTTPFTTTGTSRVLATAWIKGPAGTYVLGSTETGPGTWTNTQYGTNQSANPQTADGAVTITADTADTWVQVQTERLIPVSETGFALTLIRVDGGAASWMISDASAYTYSFGNPNNNGGTTTAVCTRTSTAPAQPVATCTDNGLDDATTYTYVVTANTGTGSATESAVSAPATVTTLAAPPQPGLTNWLPNPSFETGTGQLSVTSGNATLSTTSTGAAFGTNALVTSLPTAGSATVTSTGQVPVTAATRLTGAVQAKSGYAGSSAAVTVDYYDAAHTLLGSDHSPTTILNGTYTTVVVTGNVPAGATSAQFSVSMTTSLPNATVVTDGWILQKGHLPSMNASNYFDGSFSHAAWTATPNASTSTLAGGYASDTSLTLNWTPPAGAVSGYTIYRCAGNGCTPTTARATTSALTYLDTGAVNTTYTYRVTALTANTTGTSESAPSSDITMSTPPLAVTDLSAAWTAGSASTVTLTWTVDGATTATGYRIYRCTGTNCSPSPANLLATTSTSTPGYTDTTAATSTSYSYFVAGVNAAGSSAVSDPAVMRTPPAPPVLSAGITTATSVSLSWPAATAAAGYSGPLIYNIYRCTDDTPTASSCVPTTITGTTVATSYTDTTVTDGTSYNYRVSVTTDVEGPKSATSTVATTKPAAVTLNQSTNPADVTAGGTLVNVKFGKKPYTNTYRIAICATTGCDPVTNPDTTVNAESGTPAEGTTPGYVYTFTGLTPGQTYRVVVFTILGAVESEASNTVTVETVVDPPSSVTVDSTRENLAVNSGVETNSSPLRWSSGGNLTDAGRDANPEAVKDGTFGFSGTVTANGSAYLYNGRSGTAEAGFTVGPSGQYSAAMWVKRQTSSGYATIRVNWYTSAGVQSTITPSTESGNVYVPAGQWTRLTLQNLTPPADMPSTNTGYVTIYIKYIGAVAGERVYADDSQWEHAGTVNSSYFDGTSLGLNSGYSYGTVTGTYPDSRGVLTNAAGRTTVTWTPPASGLVGSYRVYRCSTTVPACAASGPNTSTDLVSTVSAGTTYTDSSTVDGGSYRYSVHSVSAGGIEETAGRAPTPAVTVMRPASPSNASVSSVTSTSATVSWTASDGASSSSLYPGYLGYGAWQPGFAASSPYHLTGLQRGGLYQYRVVAANTAGASAPSDMIGFLAAAARPAAPSVGNYSAATGTADITFTPPTAYEPISVATEYTLDGGASYSTVTSGTAISLPAFNTEYLVQIRTVTTFTGTPTRSEWSWATSFTTPPPPPLAPTAVVDHQSVGLSWPAVSAPPNGSSVTYQVTRSTAGNGITGGQSAVEQTTTATTTSGAINQFNDNAASGTDVLATTAGPAGVGAPTGVGFTHVLTSSSGWTSTGTLSSSSGVLSQTGSAAAATTLMQLLPGRTYTFSADTAAAASGAVLSATQQVAEQASGPVHTSAPAAAGTDRLSVTFTTSPATSAGNTRIPVVLTLTNPGTAGVVTWANVRLVGGSTVVDPSGPGALTMDSASTLRSAASGCTVAYCSANQSGGRGLELDVPAGTGANVVLYQLTHPASVYTPGTTIRMSFWAKTITGAGNNLTVIPQVVSTDAYGAVTVLASGANVTPTNTWTAYSVTGTIIPGSTPNRIGLRLVTPNGSVSTANVTVGLDALMSVDRSRLSDYTDTTYLPGQPEPGVTYSYTLTAVNTLTGNVGLPSPANTASSWLAAPAWVNLPAQALLGPSCMTCGMLGLWQPFPKLTGDMQTSATRPLEIAAVPTATGYSVYTCSGLTVDTCATSGTADDSDGFTQVPVTVGTATRVLTAATADGQHSSVPLTRPNSDAWDTPRISNSANTSATDAPSTLTGPASDNTLAATMDGGAVSGTQGAGADYLVAMRNTDWPVRLRTNPTGSTQTVTDTAANSYNVLPETVAAASDLSGFTAPDANSSLSTNIYDTRPILTGSTIETPAVQASVTSAPVLNAGLIGTNFVPEAGKNYAFTVWVKDTNADADAGTTRYSTTVPAGRVAVRPVITYTTTSGATSTVTGADTWLSGTWTQLYVRAGAPADAVAATVAINYAGYTQTWATTFTYPRSLVSTTQWMVANSPDSAPRDYQWWAGARTDNRLPDPGASSIPAAGYQTPAGVTAVDNAAPSAGVMSYDGDAKVTSITLTATQNAAGGNIALAQGKYRAAVTPGQAYTFTGVIRSPGASAQAVPVRGKIVWLNAAGTSLGTSPSAAVISSGYWQRFTVTATAPATAAYAQIAYDSTATTMPVSALSNANVKQIASGPGANHTCLVTNTGYVYCWGSNSNGQIGANTAVGSNATTPTLLSNDRYIWISVGGTSTCGQRVDNSYICYGTALTGLSNSAGIVVGGIPLSSVQGMAVNSNVVCISLTSNNTTDARVYCAGSRALNGNTGDTTSGYVSTATLVPNSDTLVMKAVVTDGTAVCGIATGGSSTGAETRTAYCWGVNSQGSFGTNTTSSTKAGVTKVVSSLQFEQLAIAAGGRVCGLSQNSLYCWGAGASVPSLQPGVTYTGIAGGGSGTTPIFCGQQANPASVAGQVACWGGANGENVVGSLGDLRWNNYGLGDSGGTDTAPATAPVTVTTPAGGGYASDTNYLGIAAVAVGAHTMCALRVGNFAACWGSNRSGQLGNPNAGFSSYTQVPVAASIPTIEIDEARLTTSSAGGFWGNQNVAYTAMSVTGALAGRDSVWSTTGPYATVTQTVPAPARTSSTASVASYDGSGNPVSQVVYTGTNTVSLPAGNSWAAYTSPGDVQQPTAGDPDVLLASGISSPWTRTVSSAYASSSLNMNTRLVVVNTAARGSTDGYQDGVVQRPAMMKPAGPLINMGWFFGYFENVWTNLTGIDVNTYFGYSNQIRRAPATTPTNYYYVNSHNIDASTDKSTAGLTGLAPPDMVPFGGTWNYQSRMCNETGCSQWGAISVYTVPFEITEALKSLNTVGTSSALNARMDFGTSATSWDGAGANATVDPAAPDAAWFSPGYQPNANSGTVDNDKAGTSLYYPNFPAASSNVRSWNFLLHENDLPGQGDLARDRQILAGINTGGTGNPLLQMWQGSNATVCIGWMAGSDTGVETRDGVDVTSLVARFPINVGVTVTGGKNLHDRAYNKIFINGSQQAYSSNCQVSPGSVATVPSMNASTSAFVIGGDEKTAHLLLRGAGLYGVAVWNSDQSAFFTATGAEPISAYNEWVGIGYIARVANNNPMALYQFKGTLDSGTGMQDSTSNHMNLSYINKNSVPATTVAAGTAFFGATGIQPAKFVPTTSGAAGGNGGTMYPIDTTLGVYVGSRGIFGKAGDVFGSGFQNMYGGFFFATQYQSRVARYQGPYIDTNINQGRSINILFKAGTDNGLLFFTGTNGVSGLPGYTKLVRTSATQLTWYNRANGSGTVNSYAIDVGSTFSNNVHMITVLHTSGTSATLYIDGVSKGSYPFTVQTENLFRPYIQVGGYEDHTTNSATNEYQVGPKDFVWLDIGLWFNTVAGSPLNAQDVARLWASRDAS